MDYSNFLSLAIDEDGNVFLAIQQDDADYYRDAPISLSISGNTYHTLDPNFLPDNGAGVGYTTKGSLKVDMNPATNGVGNVEMDDDSHWLYFSRPLPNGMVINGGDSVTIIVAGEEIPGEWEISDEQWITAFDNEDMGFSVWYDKNSRTLEFDFALGTIMQLVDGDQSKLPEVEMVLDFGEGNVIHKIDPKYLPDGLGGSLIVQIELIDQDEYGGFTCSLNHTYSEIVETARNGGNVYFSVMGGLVSIGTSYYEESEEGSISFLFDIEPGSLVGQIMIFEDMAYLHLTEVNANPDWEQNDPSHPNYIQNRTHYVDANGVVHPLSEVYLPYSIISDWNEQNSSKRAYIKNKTHYVDADGVVHQLDEKFIPDTIARAAAVDNILDKFEEILDGILGETGGVSV